MHTVIEVKQSYIHMYAATYLNKLLYVCMDAGVCKYKPVISRTLTQSCVTHFLQALNTINEMCIDRGTRSYIHVCGFVSCTRTYVHIAFIAH